MPLKIAVFTETFLPKIDGIVSILCLMLQHLNAKGHKVLLFGPPGGPEEYAGAEIVGVGGPRLPFYPEMRINIPRRRRVWNRIQEFDPDLVHIVNPFFLGPFGLSYAQRLQVPIVASYHTNIPKYVHHYHGGGFIEPIVWSYLRTIHNQAHLNLCPSSATLQDLRDHGFYRVRWWKRGIDTQHFSPGPRNDELRMRLTDGNPNDFLMLYVGRLSPEKQLEMMRDPIFQQPGVRLAMIGDGPSADSLKQFYQGTPTVFAGYMRGQELVDAYRSADAFLFPSTTETFGLVALEAMGCRMPVIAARAGGVVDIVTEGVNGFYFDPEQPEQIGGLIQRFRDNPAMRDEMAENGLIHARSRSWQATMDQLIDYYYLAMRLSRFSQAPQPRRRRTSRAEGSP
ncbi:MAG: glycosyltransferase family 1 protein [Chloroflexota bacterium]